MEVKVEGFEKKPDLVEWILNLNLNDSQESIVTRYSELLSIHKKFERTNSGSMFPTFPPKKIFGNRKEKFLQKRMRW